jgi:hypothetical protein
MWTSFGRIPNCFGRLPFKELLFMCLKFSKPNIDSRWRSIVIEEFMPTTMMKENKIQIGHDTITLASVKFKVLGIFLGSQLQV